MQAQDAATTYFFKLWEWVENNVKTVVLGAIILVIAAVWISYYFWQQSETEVAAGKALTQLLISIPPGSQASQLAKSYLKIAADYPGTQAGGRALALGAVTLYVSGQYPEAESEFQKYLRAHPGGPFAATAALGVAACLDAQQKTDSASKAYQRVISSFSDHDAADMAKFALAKIEEQRGKLADAENFYMQVARDNPNSPLGSEAALRISELRAKMPATVSTNRPPAPFKLITPP